VREKREKETTDTIAAIATPLGEGGIGIVRLSGEQALSILIKIFKRNGQNKENEIESHKLYHGFAVEPKTGNVLDEAVASYMRGPKSYTGEDCVEISCHAGIALLRQVLEGAIASGARLAQRGEFTKRAFLNGKIDLIQAEAVIDLIKAKTKTGVVVAASQLRGRLSKEIGGTRDRLIGLLARIEASIDFPDDIEDLSTKTLISETKKEGDTLGRILSSADAGRIFKEGLPTVIIGKPNVGKSSLFNALLKEDRAIVTEIPGTTRDTLEESLNIKGLPLKVVDTAGTRFARDKIEELGIERTEQALAESDLALIVIDASEPLTREDISIMSVAKGRRAILVANKRDKADASIKEESKLKAGEILGQTPVAETSALYGDGIPELEECIVKLVAAEKVVAGKDPVITNVRHKECLIRAKEALDRAGESALKGMQADFVAIDLKSAVLALGETTGEEVSEEVLDRVFSEFCVGK